MATQSQESKIDPKESQQPRPPPPSLPSHQPQSHHPHPPLPLLPTTLSMPNQGGPHQPGLPVGPQSTPVQQAAVRAVQHAVQQAAAQATQAARAAQAQQAALQAVRSAAVQAAQSQAVAAAAAAEAALVAAKQDPQGNKRGKNVNLRLRFGGKKKDRAHYKTLYIQNPITRSSTFNKLKKSLFESADYLCGRTGANVLVSIVTESAVKSTQVFGTNFTANWNLDASKKIDAVLSLLSAPPTVQPKPEQKPQPPPVPVDYKKLTRDQLKFKYRQAWKERCRGRPGFSTKQKCPTGFPQELWLPVSDMTKDQLIKALKWMDSQPNIHLGGSRETIRGPKTGLEGPEGQLPVVPIRTQNIDSRTLTATLESLALANSVRSKWATFKTLTAKFKGILTSFVVDRDIDITGDCFYDCIAKEVLLAKEGVRGVVASFEAKHANEKWLTSLWEQFGESKSGELFSKHIQEIAKTGRAVSTMEVLLTAILFNLDIYIWNAVANEFYRARELATFAVPAINNGSNNPKTLCLAHVNLSDPLSPALIPNHYVRLIPQPGVIPSIQDEKQQQEARDQAQQAARRQATEVEDGPISIEESDEEGDDEGDDEIPGGLRTPGGLGSLGPSNQGSVQAAAAAKAAAAAAKAAAAANNMGMGGAPMSGPVMGMGMGMGMGPGGPAMGLMHGLPHAMALVNGLDKSRSFAGQHGQIIGLRPGLPHNILNMVNAPGQGGPIGLPVGLHGIGPRGPIIGPGPGMLLPGGGMGGPPGSGGPAGPGGPSGHPPPSARPPIGLNNPTPTGVTRKELSQPQQDGPGSPKRRRVDGPVQ